MSAVFIRGISIWLGVLIIATTVHGDTSGFQWLTAAGLFVGAFLVSLAVNYE